MPCQQSVTCSTVKLVRVASGIALVVAISPAWLLGQESARRRRPDAAKSDEKPASEKSPAEKPANDRGAKGQRPGPVAATKVPIEEQLQRTDEGKIRFNFQGQPWPAILKWLAESSKLTLDWQELPEDNLN